MQMLIIGKNGQISSHLRLKADYFNYEALSIASSEVDLEDKNSLLSFLEKYERKNQHNNSRIIINAAAYTNVENAELEYEKALKINATAPKILAKFAKENGYLLVHYSTDYVFDGIKEGLYSEKDKTCPINKYGHSKLIGEENIITESPNHLILRTSWVFSELGVNFVKKIAELLQTKEELKVIKNQIGRPSYAGFIAEATYNLVDYYQNKNPKEIINICQPETTNWYEFAVSIKENLQLYYPNLARLLPILSSEYVSKARRPQNSSLSIEKLNQILPSYGIPSWQESLREVLMPKTEK